MPAERAGEEVLRLAEEPPATALAEPVERREALRARTLAKLGEAVVHAGPLLEVLTAPSDDPEAVTAAVQRCPTLAARLLSVTNSAAFRVGRPIDSVHRAVIHLGPSRARAIAMAFGLRCLAEKGPLEPEMVNQLWIASLRKACAARLAARLIAPHGTDAAFCLTLIQDVGLPLLVALDPRFYTHELVPGARGDWSAQETQRFGLSHAEVGYDLLVSWDASPELREATLHHHCPPTAVVSRTDALLEIPSFVGSLLPHLDEEPTGSDRDWLTVLYAQFLAPAYNSPDAFLAAAAAAAAQLHPAAEGLLIPASLRRDLIRAVTEDTVSMVGQLCRLETALGRERKGFDELRFQAFTDPLTKVLNRRGFTQLAERRLDDAVRRQLGVCCIVLDVDDFKHVNDRHGHDAGDLLLRGLAKLLRRNLDRSDLIGRLGGDEFVVLITGVDSTRACQIANRLTQACLHTRMRVAEGVETPLRVSAGAIFASRLTEEAVIDDLIRAADDAMYQRKHAGKRGLEFRPYPASDSPETPEVSGGSASV